MSALTVHCERMENRYCSDEQQWSIEIAFLVRDDAARERTHAAHHHLQPRLNLGGDPPRGNAYV